MMKITTMWLFAVAGMLSMGAEAQTRAPRLDEAWTKASETAAAAKRIACAGDGCFFAPKQSGLFYYSAAQKEFKETQGLAPTAVALDGQWIMIRQTTGDSNYANDGDGLRQNGAFTEQLRFSARSAALEEFPWKGMESSDSLVEVQWGESRNASFYGVEFEENDIHFSVTNPGNRSYWHHYHCKLATRAQLFCMVRHNISGDKGGPAVKNANPNVFQVYKKF